MFKYNRHNKSIDGLSDNHDPSESSKAGEKMRGIDVHGARIFVLEWQRLNEIAAAVDADPKDVE